MLNNTICHKKTEKCLINQIITNSNGMLRLGTKSHGAYRLQPTNPEIRITQKQLIEIIEHSKLNVIKIVDPNHPESASGKFETFYIEDSVNNLKTNFVLGRGENTGQKFERKTAEAINLENGELPTVLTETIKHIGINIEDIDKIVWSGKSNSKRKISIEPKQIGNLIADFNILLKNGKNEYISLKAKKGDTFGNHGFDDGFMKETLGDKIIFRPSYSEYDDFIVNALGADKNTIANSITDIINKIPTNNIENLINVNLNFNKSLLTKYLAGAYGYGYWYVREKSENKFQIIKLNSVEDSLKIIGDIKSVIARYPRYSENKRLCSKQFQATITTDQEKFILELRHSHRGLKPNEIKIKSLGKFNNIIL